MVLVTVVEVADCDDGDVTGSGDCDDGDYGSVVVMCWWW